MITRGKRGLQIIVMETQTNLFPQPEVEGLIFEPTFPSQHKSERKIPQINKTNSTHVKFKEFLNDRGT